MQKVRDAALRKPKICVVGASNMDLLTKVPRLPKMGETLIGNHFHIGFGGKGANQAVMAAKLGAEVAMVTKLGRDVFGEMTYKNYQECGIDTQHVCWAKESSGVAPIFVDREGHNFIVIVPGANWKLSPEDVRGASKAIKESDVVVCQLEIPLETTLEALRIAKEGEVLTVFNPAPGCSLPSKIFRLCDVIAPNRIETEAIAGITIKTLRDAEVAVKKLLSLGCKAAIITLGEKGAMVGDEEGVVKIPTIPVKPTDSTGAGDAFIGTLAYFLALDTPRRRAVRIANATAALSVTKRGTQLSFPSKNEIKKTCERLFDESLEGG
ncbi:MAG TPA: ribokinase [Thermoplasmata archaeon]|nr:ribokinase [Thermoplasmata archaeon]